MTGILMLENMNRGNTLKQGDLSMLKYRLYDADGDNLNVSGKPATVRLMKKGFTFIAYEKEGLVVSSDDTITFNINKVLPGGTYYLEVIVDDTHIFPSKHEEGKFNVDRSSLGAELNIIENVGVEALVRKVVDLVNADPNLLIDEDKLVTDIIANTGIKNIDEYYQAYRDVIKELSQTKDYHSLPEIAEARNGFDTLDNRLDVTDSQLKQAKQAFNDAVSNVTVDSEVILARGNKTTLGERVDDIDDTVDVIRGKNYLEGVDLIDGFYVENASGVLAEFDTHSVTDFISLDSGQKYIFSNSTGGLFANGRMVFYNESNTYISGYRINSGAQFEELNFTVPNNASKARISLLRTGSPDYSTWTVRRQDYRIVTSLDMKDLQPKLAAGAGINIVNNELKLDKFYASKGIITGGDLNSIDGQGTYLYAKTVGEELLNGPPISGSFTINVMRADGGWVTQVAKEIHGSVTYDRTLRIREQGGTDSVTAWKAIGTMDKLPYINETDDLDNFYTTGNAVAINPINAPVPGKTWAVVNREVRSFNQNLAFWTVQTVTELRTSKGTPPSVYSRVMQIKDGELLTLGSYTRLDNVDVPAPDPTPTPVPVEFFKDRGLKQSGDLNDFTDNGVYLLVQNAATPLSNKPFGSSGVLTVFQTYGRWTVQIAVENATGKSYIRAFRDLLEGGIDNASDWREFGKSAGGSSTLSGETWVNLGDSIFGNTRNLTSVSNQIAEKTGATTVNIGFGGSRVAQHTSNWDPFSFYRLAEEIVKDDTDPTKWASQDLSITRMKSGEITGMPGYFEIHLNDLKAIDWAEVDGVTIAGGTNDYTASVSTDNIENPEDTTTYAGALRYGLRLLMKKHPHLKVLLCTPMYRYWMDTDLNVIDDSDTREYAGQILPDFVEKAKEVGKELKIPVLDNYFELGINEFNRDLYFPAPDGTHPNAKGNKKLGYKIGSAIISEF